MALRGTLRRLFAIGWIAVLVFGGLNHGIARRVLGRRFDVTIPHLRYGYPMFNLVPRRIMVASVARNGTRLDLAEFEPTPAPGYKSARVAMDIMVSPSYLSDLCARADSPIIGTYYEIGPGSRRITGEKVICSRGAQ